MLNCDVIADLMVAYTSGEASSETKRLVEEHLARCAACSEAFGKESQVEQAVHELPPVRPPGNGRGFIARTRRLVFAVVVGGLFLMAAAFVLSYQVLMENLGGVQITRTNEATGQVLAAGVVLAAAVTFVVVWRRRRRPGRRSTEIALSVGMGILLLMLAMMAFRVMETGPMGLGVLPILCLLAALALIFAFLPRLPYMTIVTVLVMFISLAFLVMRAPLSIRSPLPRLPELVEDFGRPPEGLSLEEAARVDLSAFGLVPTATREMEYVDLVEVDSGGRAWTTTYQGNGREVFLTVVRFGEPESAAGFFSRWRAALGPAMPLMREDMTIEGVGRHERSVSTYSVLDRRAYEAWQSENWVIVIDVPGGIPQARTMARVVREWVVMSYGQQTERT